MLIDCHVHTRRYSACSCLTPEEACAVAVARGLDAIVFTEHHVRWPLAGIEPLRRSHPGLVVYAGMEITVREGFDIVAVTSREDLDITFCQPFRKVLDHLLGLDPDLFLFIAHPFRYIGKITRELRDILPHVHGIEVNSVNILRANGIAGPGDYRPANARLYDEARETWDLVPLYNSDAHSIDSLGAVASELEVEAPPPDERSLARLLRSSRPTEVLRPELLSVLFGG